MKSSTFTEFHIMSENLPSIPLNLTEENQVLIPLPSEPIPVQPLVIPSLTIQTGVIGLQETSSNSDSPFSPKSGTSSGKASSNLRSNAKPHEILERAPVEPRVLRVSPADVAALCQVITEFKEQFIE